MTQSEGTARRKRAPRFADIAAEAGVSEATVDRVLNERGSVSAASRERVVAAAARLGVKRHLPDVRHGIVHVDVLMPVNDTPFYQRFDRALQRAIASVGRRVVVHRLRIDGQREDGYLQAMLAPPYPRAGLIIAAPSTAPTVEAARAVAAAGVPVITMVSDLPAGLAHRYIGIDHYRAGQTAGYLLGQLAGGRGEVLVVPAVRSYLAHHERVQGCLDEIAAHHPDCRVVVSDDARDDANLCYTLVQRALRKHTVAGIYSTGDGALGIESALREARLLGRVAWVGHEIEDVHRRLLAARAMNLVIDQNPDGQARAVLHHLLGLAGEVMSSEPDFDGEFGLFMPTNVRRGVYLP